VKAIGESKSKQEEDRIIADEVIILQQHIIFFSLLKTLQLMQVLFLKKAIPQTGLTKKKMKELVVRSLYVEMLGQDASFAYIKAVELCASTSIMQKRAGYLAGNI
jgi:AP-4 complex subunit epsilon-1